MYVSARDSKAREGGRVGWREGGIKLLIINSLLEVISACLTLRKFFFVWWWWGVILEGNYEEGTCDWFYRD